MSQMHFRHFLFSVWSTKYEAYAKNYGKDLNLVAIDTNEFVNKMLPWMIESGFCLGVNWDHQGFGALANEISFKSTPNFWESACLLSIYLTSRFPILLRSPS